MVIFIDIEIEEYPVYYVNQIDWERVVIFILICHQHQGFLISLCNKHPRTTHFIYRPSDGYIKKD